MMGPRALEMRENIGQGCHMDKSTIIGKLREHEAELKAEGVEHLFLHGSYARGTAVRELSDVDLIAEFDTSREFSLVDRVRLENRLADMLGTKVDLAPAQMLKDDVRERAAREAVLAF